MKKIFLALMLLAPMAMQAQKIGCVDYDAVAQNLPEYAKAQGDLQALAKQKAEETKAAAKQKTNDAIDNAAKDVKKGLGL